MQGLEGNSLQPSPWALSKQAQHTVHRLVKMTSALKQRGHVNLPSVCSCFSISFTGQCPVFHVTTEVVAFGRSKTMATLKFSSSVLSVIALERVYLTKQNKANHFYGF